MVGYRFRRDPESNTLIMWYETMENSVFWEDTFFNCCFELLTINVAHVSQQDDLDKQTRKGNR